MKVVIAGAGRLGAQIAHVLLAAGNEITLIDQDEVRLAEVTLTLQVRSMPGDACEPAILEESGALNADLLISATGDDEDNLVISLLAKRQFAVPRVVARVNDADNTWLFDEHWGVDVAVPAAMPLVSLVEEAAGVTNTVALLRLAKAGVNLIETAIDESSRAAGRRIGEIELPHGSIVAAVVRRHEPIVPDQAFRLQAGDELLIVSETATEQDIRSAFQ